MSRLVKILYDVGAIHCRYQGVHEAVCGFSPRRLLGSFNRSGKVDQAAHIDGLRDVVLQLDRAREELAALEGEELDVRRGREIQRALLDYIEALAEASVRLEAICRYRASVQAGNVHPPGNEASAAKIAYDDAVQNHKRCGSRLNDLVSTL
jgi:hypothetical protein